MRSSLEELTRDLEELKAFVASIGPVNEVLARHSDPLVRQFVSIRRRFDHSAFVVALYAAFESYVEALAAALAFLEAGRLPYDQLPTKLTIKHMTRSADLLTRGRLGEGRHAGLSQLGVVENLFNCLSGSTPYVLNKAAILWHESNFRAKDVDEMFAALGIEGVCSQSRNSDSLVGWYVTVKELDAAPKGGVPDTVVETRLNNLVEMRNEVAHQGGNPNARLGVEQMLELIAFVEAFSTAVFASVAGHYLKTRYGVAPSSSRLEQLPGVGPFEKGTIVVVKTPTTSLSVGQPIFVIKSTGGARWGRIKSLKVNDEVVHRVDAGPGGPESVGLGLDFPCPKGSSLVVLDADDDLVWEPDASPVAMTSDADAEAAV